MILSHFSVFRTRGNLPGGRVDEDVHRFRERGAALNVVVANKTEDPALGEDRDVVVDGTVAKAEDDARRDAIAMHDLSRVSGSDAGAIKGFQGEKTVRRPLWVPDRDWIRNQIASQQGGCQENGAEGASRETVHA